MKNAIIILALGLLVCLSFSKALPQGVRQIDSSTRTDKSKVSNTANQQQNQTAQLQSAPQTFAAKYEGGLFGFSEKTKGTLNFDDLNSRLVFRNKENKEVFALPYASLLVVSPNSRSVSPTAARVGSAIPVPGAGLLGLITSKSRYLVVQFADPDSQVVGTASFKLENKALLQSVIQTLGSKAQLKQRGDAFYRPRKEEARTL